jgi:predicted metal-binding protein
MPEEAEAVAGPPAIVTICTTCRAPGVAREEAPGLRMLAAVAAAAEGLDGVAVRPTQCLGLCKRACTVSISGEGRYVFLFGDLDPDADAEAVVAMARSCAAAPYGFVAWKDRPEALRKGMIARVPPPGWSPEDGGAPA